MSARGTGTWKGLALVGSAILSMAASPPDTVRVSPGDPLQAAVDEAPEGATLILEPGTHRGPLAVPRTVTILGHGDARIQGDGSGSVVTLEAGDVQLRALEVTGSGRNLATDDAGVLVLGDRAEVTGLRLHRNLHGIYVRGAVDVRLEDNEILGLAAAEDPPEEVEPHDDPVDHPDHRAHHPVPPSAQALMGNGVHLWDADGAVVAGNDVGHVRDGIYVAHTNGAVFRDNRVGDSRYGIHYMYSDGNAIQANELFRNVAGVALMFSRDLEVTDNLIRDHGGFRAYGLLLQDVDASRVEGNRIVSSSTGIRVQSSNTLEFRGNRVTGNVTGLVLGSASRGNRLSRNRMGPNLHDVELTGPEPPTDWSVDGVGNRWSGALPMDLDGDGISEWPHHAVDVLGERSEAFPPARLLAGSPGLRALEWALGRVPVPGSRYVTDPHPMARDLPDD